MTQDTSPRPLAGEGQGVRATETAVNPKTWKKLVLLAETHWADGTRDDVDIETLQPPEWIGEHDVRIGASIALPLDLVEMGLPAIFTRRLSPSSTAPKSTPALVESC